MKSSFLILVLCLTSLACSGGGSGLGIPSPGVGENSVGTFTPTKKLSTQEVENFDKGCSGPTEIDARLKPGMTFKNTVKFVRQGLSPQTATFSLRVQSLDQTKIRKRLSITSSTSAELPAGHTNDFTCATNSELYGLDCGQFTELGTPKKKGPNGQDSDDYCSLKGGEPDPKDTFEVVEGTFTFAETKTTVKAFQTKRTRHGIYKCNNKEGKGQERYTNIISFEAPSVFGKFCDDTILVSFSETTSEERQVLHSSLWEILSIR